ncbi:hypothetical protein D3C77_654200 [compost metagenome]
MARTEAEEAILLLLSVPTNSGAVGAPVKAGLVNGALSDSRLVIVAAKFGSLPNAAASSFRVSSAAGDDAISAAIALITNLVLAANWVLLPIITSGTDTAPVNVAPARLALRARA